MNASRKHAWSRLLPESLSDSENCILHRLSRNVGKIYQNSLRNPLLAAHNSLESNSRLLRSRCLKTRYPILFQKSYRLRSGIHLHQLVIFILLICINVIHSAALSICAYHMDSLCLKTHWNSLDYLMHSVYSQNPKPFVIFISSMHSRLHYLPRDAALFALK